MSDKTKNDALKALTEALSITTQYADMFRNINTDGVSRLVDALSAYQDTTAIIGKIVTEQTELMKSLNLPTYDIPTMNILTAQWDSIARIIDVNKTPEIARLQSDLMLNNFSGVYTFVNTLRSQIIESPNIALLKIAPIFNSYVADYPKGIPSILKKLHVETARRLANSDNISLDVPSQTFFIQEEPEEKASIAETNIVCSALMLLSGLDESALIKFLNHLSKFPTLAMQHRVGQQIYEIISDWYDTIDFDCQYYYHARILEPGECPYTESQLLKAPTGITWHGRYNHPGQSHYYFSDKPKGALLEVRKHSKEKRVQIARIKPKRRIQMIDLSQELMTPNKFLEFCRFIPAPNDYSNIKREYLIPCFVADCCRLNGVEGIKYYGSKEYANYVTWSDDYFEFVDFEIYEE